MRSGLQRFCWFRGLLHIRLDRRRSLPIAVHSICVGLHGKRGICASTSGCGSSVIWASTKYKKRRKTVPPVTTKTGQTSIYIYINVYICIGELMRSGLQRFCWFRGLLHIRLDGRSLPIAVYSICVGLQGGWGLYQKLTKSIRKIVHKT